MRPAVFLDKDGTLVRNVPYNVDPALVSLEEGAGPALVRLAEHGYALVLVSNQSGVARGLFDVAALDAVTERIQALLHPFGVQLAGAYYCPHHPEGNVEAYATACACRKPGDGLLRAAAADLGLSLRDSWMVGDILDDIEAGRRAGCRTVLLDVGHETEWTPGPLRVPDRVAADLMGAAETILQAVPAGDREEVAV